MDYLYIVATNKEVLVTIRIAPDVRDQFKKAAELRGSTMSGLMHQFIVRTIREETEAAPQEFGVRRRDIGHRAPVAAHISPSEETKTRRRIEADLQDHGPLPAARIKVQREPGHKKKTGTGR